jgi:hypothetical protein
MSFFDGSELYEGIAAASVALVRASGARPHADADYRDVPVRDVLEVLEASDPTALAAESLKLGERVVFALEERRQRMHTLDERRGLFDI